MQLRKEINFRQTRHVNLNFASAENPVSVVYLSMPLSVENAEALEIGWVMNGSVARDADIALKLEIEHAEFSMPAMPKMRADIVHRLKLKRINDANYELQMIVHFPIHHSDELLAFWKEHNKDTFTVKINSLQQELFDGKRVALSGKDAAAGKEEPEEIAQDDNAARQPLVTHCGNGKGHALPFDTTIAGAKASAAGKRRSARA